VTNQTEGSCCTMTAVVVTSGGMDSTTAVYCARLYFDSIECMSFDYGQRHVKELQCAAEIAAELGVKWHPVNLQAVTSLIATSALTNPVIDVPEGHYEEESRKATIVPNRNAMMVNL